MVDLHSHVFKFQKYLLSFQGVSSESKENTVYNNYTNPTKPNSDRVINDCVVEVKCVLLASVKIFGESTSNQSSSVNKNIHHMATQTTDEQLAQLIQAFRDPNHNPQNTNKITIFLGDSSLP